jgi:hypothetical protein
MASPFAGITYPASSTETNMNTKQTSLDRRDTQDAAFYSTALYPTRSAGRPRDDASTLHGRLATFDAPSPLPLARIFHPYEYWAYATPDGSGDVASLPSRAEPEPPKSGWPVGPPAIIGGWWRWWSARGLFRSGAT